VSRIREGIEFCPRPDILQYSSHIEDCVLTLRKAFKQLKDPQRVDGQLNSDPANSILEAFSPRKRRLVEGEGTGSGQAGVHFGAPESKGLSGGRV